MSLHTAQKNNTKSDNKINEIGNAKTNSTGLVRYKMEARSIAKFFALEIMPVKNEKSKKVPFSLITKGASATVKSATYKIYGENTMLAVRTNNII